MKCPGQDSQYWNDEAIYDVECPECSALVEFYKDDTQRKCHACGHRFVNPKMDFGCAAYCQYAEQCLGTLPDEFVGSQDNLLKDKVAVEMKRLYKSDFHRIGHATRVARYAEEIGKIEGGNLAVILCAAYLYNIESAQVIQGSGKTSTEVAAEILERLKAKDNMTQAVCAILANPEQPVLEYEAEQNILHDAGKLALLEEHKKAVGSGEAIEAVFQEDALYTDTGRQLSKKISG